MPALLGAALLIGTSAWASGTEEGTAGSGAAMAGDGQYKEAPMLAAMVAAGDLPPLEERLPIEPNVLVPLEEVGTYGGTLNVFGTGAHPWVDGGDSPERSQYPLRMNFDGSIEPDQARDYELSDDNMTFTLYLREGMKWSNGDPFTAEDFRFKREMDLDEGISTWGYPEQLESITAVDDYTVRYDFRVPYPRVVLNMLHWRGSDWRAYAPSKWLKQWHIEYNPDANAKAKEEGHADWAAAFNDHYTFCCPAKDINKPSVHAWMWKEQTTTVRIWERNPYHYAVDTAGQQLPYIDRIVSTKVEGPEGASLKIIAGEVDLADELAKISSLPLYRENEDNGYRALGSGVPYNPVVHAFNFAYEDPVWRQLAGDLRFRKALNLAINRDEIIDAVYYGFASPPEWVPATYDPDEAGRLLDAVGLDKRDSDGWRLGPDGERFEINLEVTAHLPDTVPANELIAEHYRAVGLYTTLEVVEIGLFIERRNANQYQIDTLWNEATTLHAFGHAKHHLIGHIPPWSQWYNSGGEQGEEPPAWFQELYDLGLGIGPGIPWDQEIVDRYQQTFYDTIPQINVTYNPATVLIVNQDLRNVFTEGVAQWVIYSSEQLYYES
jgi:peptide/nickel transport system substrate-binding protein